MKRINRGYLFGMASCEGDDENEDEQSLDLL